jgi:transcriptional regulator with GAF, ATPase, and Fis domain
VSDSTIPGIIGESTAIRHVAALVRVAAASDVTVLIEGETGTGKELVARAVAALGARRDRPVVAINCGALPESMLDAELFGHRHGAFTGASGDRRGLLESADGGTLFLDEITSMSPGFQARLLRVLESGEIRPVGCDRVRRVDLRVLVASNLRLEDCVARGDLRSDLYYRLNVFPIALPPLRERREDIPSLVTAFLGAVRRTSPAAPAAVSGAALEQLIRGEYPGNVRQLKNEIARAAVLAAGCERIEVAHLAACAPAGRFRAAVCAAPLAIAERRGAAIAELERQMIREALESHGYNVSRAAAALRLSRFGLRKRMQRLGLTVGRSLIGRGTTLSVAGTAS